VTKINILWESSSPVVDRVDYYHWSLQCRAAAYWSSSR